MKKNITSGITICLFLSLASFGNAEQAANTEKAAADNSATPPAAAAQSTALSGKVLETMSSGGYTYLKLDTGSSQPWVAIPETPVKVGDEVTCSPGMAMANFTSKTLNRTFDSVFFSAGLIGIGGKTHGGMATATASPYTPKGDTATATAGTSGGETPFSEIHVEKAAGKNSYTIKEIFAKTKDLNGKSVRIQGKVVKYTPSIMGRNWIHLQDGTGDPTNNTHDLTITTAEEINKGDIITIEGVVAFQKDFGSGYKYDAIVEEAKTVK